MPRVRCPECQRTLNIPATNEGKAVRCSACKAKFTLDAAEEPEWLNDRAHAAALANEGKSAAYEMEAEERRLALENAKSDRRKQAMFFKVVDLIGLGVMIAVVLPSAMLCLLSFVSELAAILSTMFGVLAILLGVIVFFLLLFIEGIDVSGSDLSLLMRLIWPFVCMIQYTIQMPRRVGPWFVILVCGTILLLAGIVINAVVQPPFYPGWKPSSNPGPATANNVSAPPGKDRSGPDKSGPPKVTGDATLDQALVDLEKGDSSACLTAINKLVKIPPVPEHRALIAKKLAARATDPDVNIRRGVIQALGVWGTTNEVPTLIGSLNDSDFQLRSQTLQIIGKFRDERTLGPVSRCFAEGATRNDACKAFRDMGSMAENEVLPYLKSGDVFVRLDAVNVLKDIGTQASVPALKAVLAMDNAFTNRAAKDALAAIARRM